MSKLIDQITQQENLYWAWLKAKRYYQSIDNWYDQVEVSCFEANLDSELKNIRNQFKKLNYKTSPIYPLAEPKKNDRNRIPQARQRFNISVKDQVAWIAFVNVIGPFLDYEMPNWSYGYRLYRSVWYEEDSNGKDILKIGWYRNSLGYLYRNFNQGWPLFRHHAYLTIRKMSRDNSLRLGNSDQKILDNEVDKPDPLKLNYLKEDFWNKAYQELYWITIDLKKFYPNIKLKAIVNNIIKYSPIFEKEELQILTNQLLRFKLNSTDLTDDELKQINIKPNQKYFSGLPTGLFVAGFLSNIALLNIDKELDTQTKEKQIAHFRFVDDHIILSSDFNGLVEWINNYQKLMKNNLPKVKINLNKTRPIEMGKYLKSPKSDDRMKKAMFESKLDPKFPSPLMTETINLVSDIARIEFDLLDDKEQEHLMDDLEHLLLANIPDIEIREDTRVCFAASRISRLGSKHYPTNMEYSDKIRELNTNIKYLKILESKSSNDSKEQEKLTEKISSLKVDCNNKKSKIENLKKDIELKVSNDRRHVFSLLMKAINQNHEKLTLWVKLLGFCKNTGHDELTQIIEQLDELNKMNPLTSIYLRSFILQILTGHIIQCLKVILNQNINYYDRITSKNYLLAILKSLDKIAPKDASKDIEKKSQFLVKFLIGSTIYIISQNRNTNEFIRDSFDIDNLMELGSKCKAIDWNENPLQWVNQHKISLDNLVWWFELTFSNKLSNNPSAIWNKYVSFANINDICGFFALSRYPRYLSPKIANEILINNNYVNTYGKSKDNGWLYELAQRESIDKKEIIDIIRRFNSKVYNAINGYPNKINLYEWCKWSNKQWNENPFDPRISEWVSLKIVEAVIKEIGNIKNISNSKELFIHPANIYIPNEFNLNQGDLTWEECKKLTDDKKLKITIKQNINDFKFMSVWDIKSTEGFQKAQTKGLALILLGLINRSYDWPSMWIPKGHMQAHETLIRSLISQSHCSSYTRSIFESCLIPRPQESFILRPLFKLHHDYDDTINDLPEIVFIHTLQERINLAIQKLDPYRITVHAYMARQLIPVSLKQIGNLTEPRENP